MSELSASDVRSALIAAGITGEHQSHPRSKNIAKIHSMLDDDIESRFGIEGIDRYSAQEILSFVAEVTGCPGDIADVQCDDEIAPEKTLAALAAAGERLGAEARRGASILVATGHPTGVLEFHARILEAFRDAGGKPIRLREGDRLAFGSSRYSEVRYVWGVGCLADWGNLRHTHSSAPMEALLEEGPWPDLVLGDHGFAGAAIQRGIPTIAVMDINDPALAVAAAEGKDVVIIPMDDNRPPRLYEPAWRYVSQLIAAA